MKKIIVLLLSTIVCLLLTACGGGYDYSQRLSQIRYACFDGASEEISVKAYSEARESPLKADGYTGELKNFVIIKLTFLTEQKMLIAGLSVNFSTDKQYCASMAYRPESESYVCTVAVDKLPDSDFTTTVTYGDKNVNVNLEKIKTDIITPTKALAAATDYKAQLLKELLAEDKDFEISVRLVVQSDKQYYFVGITETEYTTALLIDPTGKVLAEKRLKNQ